MRFLKKKITLDQLFSQICYHLTLKKNLPKQIDCQNKKEINLDLNISLDDAKDNPLLYTEFKEKQAYICFDDIQSQLTDAVKKPNLHLKKYFLKDNYNEI